MPKISRFFGYWRKKHRFMPKSAIYTLYRYVQNKLSSLAACLPLSPSPGAGRQLSQSSLETAWSCTQHPVCIPIKEGFSMLQIKKPLIFKGFSGDGGIRTHVPGISRQTHFECAALRPLRYVSVYLWGQTARSLQTAVPYYTRYFFFCVVENRIFFIFYSAAPPKYASTAAAIPATSLSW